MHNCRVKTYPDGTRDYLLASSPIFREPGWELAAEWAPRERRGSAGDGGPEATERAKRRARNAVRDLAMANEDFSYFVTLTLSPERVDRYDMGAVVKKLNSWADNRVRRQGLKYVLVPELHKDGAVHFHGFLNSALPLVDSGTVIPPSGGRPRKPRSARQRAEWLAGGGHLVYNIPGWTLGFSSAIELYGDRASAVGYVCKYISKALTKIGGRWYYSGGQLLRPAVELLDVDSADVDFYAEGSFPIAALNVRCLSYKGGSDDADLSDQ